MLREIGPTAIGDSAKSAAAAYNLRPRNPSVTRMSMTAKSAAIPQSAIRLLKAKL